jgi:hypothetical protein
MILNKKLSKILVWLVIINIYGWSCYINYNWISTAYSKGGIHESFKPKKNDVYWTYCPVFNTLAAISNLITCPYKDCPSNDDIYTNHFDVKK